MTTESKLRFLLLSALVALSVASGAARADDIPVITGEHWTKSTDQMKKAYLVGIANFLQVEAAYEAASPPTDAQSVVPRFVRGLKGQTLDSVREGLDKWYASNPDKIQRPVIETVWFEMVMPGLKKSM